MRRIRVYDSKGDFIIEVPDDAKVTFGYFNPSRDEGGAFQPRGGYGAQTVAKQTALRIYEKGEKGNQLACFIGVHGFRDEAIDMTRLREEVTIVREYHNDGEGTVKDNLDQKALMKAVREPEF